MFRIRPETVVSLLISLVAIGSLMQAQEAEQSAEASGITAQVDKIFERWSKPTSPGCALGVYREGQIIYKRGYGMADLDHDVPIMPSTVFNIASVSKQFTAAAIALLAQRGKLSLDDEVRKYIPELPDFGAPITLRHLIHHTSGLREEIVLVALAGWRIGLDHVTEQDVLGLLFRQRELNFRPGERYEYSNTNYTLLAVIVERVSGQSFREFTRAHIFEPLGMRNSFFRDDHAEIVKNLAYGYVPTKGDTFRLSELHSDTVGGSGLLTTVEDLARWDGNFYDGRVGGIDLIEQLHQAGKLDSGEELKWNAFGLLIATYRGLPIVEHSGGGAGYEAHLIRFPEQRFSVACLCNTTTHPSELARRVADLYLAKEVKDPPSAPPDRKAVELFGSSAEFMGGFLRHGSGVRWAKPAGNRQILAKNGYRPRQAGLFPPPANPRIGIVGVGNRGKTAKSSRKRPFLPGGRHICTHEFC